MRKRIFIFLIALVFAWLFVTGKNHDNSHAKIAATLTPTNPHQPNPRTPLPAEKPRKPASEPGPSLLSGSTSSEKREPPVWPVPFETNDGNANENEAICETAENEYWTLACEQVARYFGRNRDWSKAGEYAEKSCRQGRTTGCTLLAKTALQSSDSTETAFLAFKRGCDSEDGQGSPYGGEGKNSYILLDRFVCATFRKYADPEEGWDAILKMSLGIPNETFADYLDQEF